MYQSYSLSCIRSSRSDNDPITMPTAIQDEICWCRLGRKNIKLLVSHSKSDGGPNCFLLVKVYNQSCQFPKFGLQFSKHYNIVYTIYYYNFNLFLELQTVVLYSANKNIIEFLKAMLMPCWQIKMGLDILRSQYATFIVKFRWCCNMYAHSLTSRCCNVCSFSSQLGDIE